MHIRFAPSGLYSYASCYFSRNPFIDWQVIIQQISRTKKKKLGWGVSSLKQCIKVQKLQWHYEKIKLNSYFSDIQR
mgnify:CR=1 FL=1